MKYLIFTAWLALVLQSSVTQVLLLLGAVYLAAYAIFFALCGIVLYCGVKLIKMIWES